MLIGFNTNIKYKGKTYHVQTEDGGIANPYIITLLYYQGAILSSKKTNYSYLLGQPDFEDKLRELMKQQHREMIRELKNIEGGVNKDQEMNKDDLLKDIKENKSIVIDGVSGNKGQTGEVKSLDDILIDYIIRRRKR